MRGGFGPEGESSTSLDERRLICNSSPIDSPTFYVSSLHLYLRQGSPEERQREREREISVISMVIVSTRTPSERERERETRAHGYAKSRGSAAAFDIHARECVTGFLADSHSRVATATHDN